jgi:hypothetical protein
MPMTCFAIWIALRPRPPDDEDGLVRCELGAGDEGVVAGEDSICGDGGNRWLHGFLVNGNLNKGLGGDRNVGGEETITTKAEIGQALSRPCVQAPRDWALVPSKVTYDPGLKSVMLELTETTTPAPSWPRTKGFGMANIPFRMLGTREKQ